MTKIHKWKFLLAATIVTSLMVAPGLAQSEHRHHMKSDETSDETSVVKMEAAQVSKAKVFDPLSGDILKWLAMKSPEVIQLRVTMVGL